MGCKCILALCHCVRVGKIHLDRFKDHACHQKGEEGARERERESCRDCHTKRVVVPVPDYIYRQKLCVSVSE